jgi:hypothetical protein
MRSTTRRAPAAACVANLLGGRDQVVSGGHGSRLRPRQRKIVRRPDLRLLVEFVENRVRFRSSYLRIDRFTVAR